MLTRESILSERDRDIREVMIPEWGGSIYVKSMTGQQRERYEALQGKETNRIRAYVVAWCACNANGDPLFSEADVEALNTKSIRPLHAVYMAALRVSAVIREEMEELEKKSEPTPGNSSSTGSQTNGDSLSGKSASATTPVS